MGDRYLGEIDTNASRIFGSEYHVIIESDSTVDRLEIEIHSVEKAMELSPEKTDEIIRIIERKGMKEVFLITWSTPPSYRGQFPAQTKFDSYELARDKIAELLDNPDPDFSDFQFQIQKVFVKA